MTPTAALVGFDQDGWREVASGHWQRLKDGEVEDFTDGCYCDEGGGRGGEQPEPHDHCANCGCILTSYEGDVCCWCEERED